MSVYLVVCLTNLSPISTMSQCNFRKSNFPFQKMPFKWKMKLVTVTVTSYSFECTVVSALI